MGCDYYHEAAARSDVEDPSDEPADLTLSVSVRDADGNQVDEQDLTVEIPVAGKAYVYPKPERPDIQPR